MCFNKMALLDEKYKYIQFCGIINTISICFTVINDYVVRVIVVLLTIDLFLHCPRHW